MKKKTQGKVKSPLLVFLCSIISTGCSQSGPIVAYEIPKQSEAVSILATVKYDYENAIFDDFLNGIDYDRWIICNGAWGEKNGGVVPENVSYTDEGVVLLRGNGDYYTKGEVKGVGDIKDGTRAGSCLVSKFDTGPGRYEIRMKPLPRKGACTAFWTYNNIIKSKDLIYNHEIDIELPGGHDNPSFGNILNTNYVSTKMWESYDVKLANVETIASPFMNDGQFHTFGFEWYTNPKIIVYFYDGIITNVSTNVEKIPTFKTKVWIGNWFPSFVGEPNFESDYMQVDWFKYIPFDNSQPYDDVEVAVSVQSALRNQYPSSPVSMPSLNLISNNDFEFVNRVDNYEYYGWSFSKNKSESSPREEVSYISKNGSFDGSACAIADKGGRVDTTIDSVYAGFKYDLSFDYISSGNDSVAEITFYNLTGNIIQNATRIIELKSNEWTNDKVTFTAPKNSEDMRIRFYNTNSNSEIRVDNVSLVRNYGENS